MTKAIITIAFSVFVLTTQGQPLYSFDFETSSTLPKFTTFGTDYELYENPKESRLNPSLLVGKVHKLPGESISWSGIATEVPVDMDLTNGGLFKMKVFATTRKGKVIVKVEGNRNDITLYSSAQISKLNEWQELTFSFRKSEHTYTRLVISFDVHSVEPHIFFFDDLEWMKEGTQPN